MTLAILIPVLARPQNVEPLLHSIAESTPGDPRIVFICDPGDRDEIDAVGAAGAEALIVSGGYATKINRGVACTTESLIFLGADDLSYQPGWLEAATAKFDPAQVVGINDLIPRPGRPEHATHFLVHRDYVARGTIDEPGKLLHEGYEHEYVDDEFVGTASSRGAYVYAPDAVVEHLHPMVGKAPTDSLYAAQGRRMRRTRRIFDARRPLWTSRSA